MIPYLVCQFSKPTLSNLVKECFGSDFPDVFNKPQVNFLFHYLEDLGAKSILLEREYQDKDYLEDFSRYYVKCFQNGGHKCARLHFFQDELNHTKLDRVLMEGKRSADYGTFQASYLGFIVIKPLPMTFIGKTCLRLYPELASNTSPDSKLLCRRYHISLFGIDLHVDSIAFQEQDKVVSACATTAIWSALHGCPWKDDRLIPACSEITTHAINHIEGSNNSFPNKGLSHKQILRALDFEDLKHHMERVPRASKWEILDIVRCHIDSNIPLILGADIYNKDGTFMGEHAVTILGYQKEGEKLSLYVHDDRLGPFAKARVIENGGRSLPKSLRKQSDIKCLLTLQHKDSKGKWKPPHEYLKLSCLIIPTQKKVRIPYDYPLRTCQLIVEEFENWLTGLSEEAHTAFSGALTFSMQLCEVSEIKRKILGLPLPRGKDRDRFKRDRANLLTQSCARFQWVGIFSFYEERAFRILIDATDIPQGKAITNIFIKNQKYSALLREVFRGYTVEEHLGSFIHLVYKYINKDPQHDFNHHLDQTYGHLRAPQYLKPEEISNGDIKHNPNLQVYYEMCEKSLDEIYGLVPKKQGLIWAIAADGGLLIGIDKGHPTLTEFKPARISGELKRTPPLWKINVKSGRYSRDYPNAPELLENTLYKFKSIFPKSSEVLHIEEVPPPA